MNQQPSNSAGAGTSKTGERDGDPIPTDGEEEAVASTSGGSVPVQQQQEEEEGLVFHGPASFKQIKQLFGATCGVKVQRCQLPTPPVAKVEEDSDSTGSGSSSEDDEVKVLPPPPPPAARLAKKKSGVRVTKKKRGKRVSGRKSSSASCTVCGKSMTKWYLKIHMGMHTGKKGHKCKNCGRSFWTLSALTNHNKSRDHQNGVCPLERKTFGGRRPKGAWICQICGKRLKCRASQYGHMRIHRGDKPFKCGECGKAFGRKDELSLHKRIHTGTWQYTCVFCDKGFHHKSNLFTHLRIHTEEKPFFCVVDGCGASFRHSTSLKSHRQLIHLKKY